MAYRGYTVELTFGQKGMIRHDNRLLSEPGDILDADNVSFADDYIAQAPIRRQYGVMTTPISAAASWTGARRYAMCAMSLQGSPAIAAGVQALATTASIVGVSNTFTVTSTTTTGRALAVVVGYRTQGDIPKDYLLSDTKGNTYTLVRNETRSDTDTTPNSFWVTMLFLAENHTTLVAAVDQITATYEDPTEVPIGSKIGIVASEYSNIRVERSVTGSAEKNAKAATSFTTTMVPIATAPQVLIAVSVLDQKTSVAAVTAGSGFTLNGNVQSGSSSEVDLRVFLEHRILTAVQSVQGMHDFWSGAQTSFGPIASITTVQGSADVVGVGSTFTGHAPGDLITIAAETQVILTITDDTHLMTVDVWRTSGAPTTYQIVAGNRLITASTDKAIFKEKPLSLTFGDLDAVTLVSGLTPHGNPVFFVEGGKEVAANNKKLFAFDGTNRVRVLSGDGATMTTITTPPADWDVVANPFKQPVGGVIHQGRLVAFGNLNDPFRYYFSTTTNHEDFTTVGQTFSQVVRSDIGQRIYCAASIQGVLFTWLYPRGIFFLNDEDLVGANWSTKVKSVNIGCAPTPYAVVPLDDDALFLSADGSFHLLSAVQEFGGFLTSDLSRSLGLQRWLRENINVGRLDQVVSCYDQYQRVAYFGVPSIDSDFNDMVLKFDFGLVDRGGTIRFSYGTRDHATGLTIRKWLLASVSTSDDGIAGSSAPIIGENGLADLILDPDTFGSVQSTGVDTNVVVQTPHLDFSHADSSLRFKRKNWQALELTYETATIFSMDDNSDITVEVYVDQELRETLDLTLAATGNTLRRIRTVLHCGDGYTISFRILKNIPDFGAGAGIKLTGAFVSFVAGDESQSR